MDPANERVVDLLNEIADILEITGTDRFRPLAYRKAARTVEALPRPVSDYISDGSLSELSGIGEAIAAKITEFIRNGKLEYLENLRKGIPPGLLEMLKLQDVGPKTVARLFAELKVTSIDELQKACEEHRVRGLRGFGERTEAKLLQSISFYRGSSGRFLLSEADAIAARVVQEMKQYADRISVAGSLRRRKETVGDIDIIICSDRPQRAMDALVALPEVETVLASGETKSSVTLKNGIQVDVRVVDESSYGAALLYFTGSKDHNVQLRTISIERNFKLNEYALYSRKDDSVVAGRTEEEVYSALGLDFIPPELREARGEIEAAAAHRLPKIVRQSDIRGDLHCHTDWSDGSSSLEEMVTAAQRLGYEYIGITDHSGSVKVANGLSAERMDAQIRRIEKLNESGKYSVHVLCGSEVDILPDGRLDYDDSLLSRLDYTIGSIHSRFNMEQKEMTDRILTAFSNEHLTVFGHPTAREIGRREQIDFSKDRVFSAAKEFNVCLEINGSPERLDLNDALIIEASKYGCTFAADTDSHHTSSLSNMQYAISMARRGWLEAESIINTSGFPGIMHKLRSR
jgi:DNA polymerase (family 10)